VGLIVAAAGVVAAVAVAAVAAVVAVVVASRSVTKLSFYFNTLSTSRPDEVAKFLNTPFRITIS